MKITFNTTPQTNVLFRDLEVGDCFIGPDVRPEEAAVFMKLSTDGRVNAVRLSGGFGAGHTHHRFDTEKLVKVYVEAKASLLPSNQ